MIDLSQISLQDIESRDFETLVQISTSTFLEHSGRLSPHPESGPSGFDSLSWHWQASMRGVLQKIMYRDEIIGGLYLTLKDDGSAWVNRVFINTPYQGKGIGHYLFSLLEKTYSQVRLWGLDTPEWAKDNLSFYQSLGYRKKELRYMDKEGFNLVILEKRI